MSVNCNIAQRSFGCVAVLGVCHGKCVQNECSNYDPYIRRGSVWPQWIAHGTDCCSNDGAVAFAHEIPWTSTFVFLC
jgi:hypothetical protein